MAMTFEWTDQRVAEASRLWIDGKSASEIARVFGVSCTRYAILGKLRRIGVAGRNGSGVRATRKAVVAMSEAILRPAWTDDDDHELELLLATGMTSRRIGVEIGRSYDAVKRRICEIGLTRPVVEARELRAAAKNGMQVVHMATAAKMAERFKCEADEPALEGCVTIAELKSHHCRWPFGEPRDFDAFRYCGAAKEPGAGPYCQFHFLAALTPEGRARHEAKVRFVQAHVRTHARGATI